MNALLYLTRAPQVYTPATSTLYTLLSPCIECAKAILTAGIGRVVIYTVAHIEGAQYLAERGVRVQMCASEQNFHALPSSDQAP
jgi:deoxycytidylate deaminase